MTALEDMTELVRRHQKRCARAILEAKDQGVVGDELRKVVLDAVGEFADVIVAVLPSATRDDIMLNGYAIELLERIHSSVTEPAHHG